MKNTILFLCLVLLFSACNKDDVNDEGPYLQFKFKFDPAQERLGSFGTPVSVPAGHAAQTPTFNSMSAHFIELVPSVWTPYKSGAQVYMGAETTDGGDIAIDFDKAIVEGEVEGFHRIPLSEVTPGIYNHLRVSVAYQNYDVKYNITNIPLIGDVNNQSGTVASFLGYNTYITSITPRTKTKVLNANRRQGYWAFETNLTSPYEIYNQLIDGEAPVDATTVVNPFEVPIPGGSCVVGGDLDQALTITGEETEDVTITLSFSINDSFEWVDGNNNGQWDLDADGVNVESVVDMGLRGLKGIVE